MRPASLTFLSLIIERQILGGVRANVLGVDQLAHALGVHRPPHHQSVAHNEPYDLSVDGGEEERGVEWGTEAALLNSSHWARAAAVYPCREGPRVDRCILVVQRRL